MFEKIVWATDGSEFAERALRFALELADRDGTEIVAVHVNELIGSHYPVLADEDDIRRALEAKVEDLRGRGIRARLLVVTTGPADIAGAIADAATTVAADAIVVGTHGRGGVGSALLGSVARRLLHKADCPVLAVPVLHLRGSAGANGRATTTAGGESR